MVDSLIRLENLRRLNKTAKELEAARKIEEKLGLVRGQMDQEHGISSATIAPPSLTVTASATNQAPELTAQCRDIAAMLATLPDDPFVRNAVMGQITEVIARARGSPSASHQEPPAYQSQAATRTG